MDQCSTLGAWSIAPPCTHAAGVTNIEPAAGDDAPNETPHAAMTRTVGTVLILGTQYNTGMNC